MPTSIARVRASDALHVASFAPTNQLKAQYTVTVGTGVKDLDGNAMPQGYSFYFVTAGVF